MDARSRSLRKHGLTPADYDKMVETQNGRCMICNTDQPGTESGHWPVDHDHATGRVRALLCSACNAGPAGPECSIACSVWRSLIPERSVLRS